MTHLTAKEFLDFQKQWYEKHNEYLDKLKDLNILDVDIVYVVKLKKEYEGYTDRFTIDKYTEITDEYIKLLSEYGDNPKHAQEVLNDTNENLGRKFKGWKGEICTLIGVVTTIEDYYYLGKDKNENLHFYSCVGKLEFIDHENK